jgi:hypothetical protein
MGTEEAWLRIVDLEPHSRECPLNVLPPSAMNSVIVNLKARCSTWSWGATFVEGSCHASNRLLES